MMITTGLVTRCLPLSLLLGVRLCLSIAAMIIVLAIHAQSQQVSSQKLQNWRGMQGAALLQLSLGDTTAAIVQLNRMIAAAGDSAEAYALRAQAFVRFGRIEEALKDYTTAIEKERDDKKALGYYLERGQLYAALKRYAEAVRDFGLCTAIDVNCAPAYYQRGLVASAMGNWDEALVEFADAARLEPQEPEALLQMAVVEIKRQRPTEARKHLDAALVVAPDFAQAYYVRASVLIDEGAKEEACKDLSTAASFGYKAALDLMRTQCRGIVSAKQIDSLQTFVMEEVTVEAAKDITTRAAQEMKVVKARTRQVAAALKNRVSGVVRPTRFVGSGNGMESQLQTKPEIVGAGAIIPTTFQQIEGSRSSRVNLDDMIFLTQERVMKTGNEKAQKILRVIMEKRSQLAALIFGEQAGEGHSARVGFAAQRALIDEIAGHIQEIADILGDIAEGATAQK